MKTKYNEEECLQFGGEWVKAHYDKNGVYIKSYCRKKELSSKKFQPKIHKNQIKEEVKKLQWKPVILGDDTNDLIMAHVKVGNKNGVLVINKLDKPSYHGKDEPYTYVPDGAYYQLLLDESGNNKWYDGNGRFSYFHNTKDIMHGRTHKNGDDVIKQIAYKKYKEKYKDIAGDD